MARTAKKKIPIYDEGVLLVEDADQLDFTGTGVTGSATNANVTEDIPGDSFVGVNTHKITVSATAPSSPALYDLWVDIS